ncbi:MAG: type II toxin-antitoxin system VapC family toxin [Gaiella sp.]
MYASRTDSPQHGEYLQWLSSVVRAEAPFGLSELVLCAVVRIVTNPRAFVHPMPLDAALRFVEGLRAQPNAAVIAPGRRHWTIFSRLCREVAAKGNLVPDAYLAALAIESGSEWITTDRDFSRFPGLRWRHPLDG